MEKELSEELKKIEAYEKECNQNKLLLESKINRFNKVAWSAVCLGFIVGTIGLIALNSNFKLNEVGDFIGGTTASLWSLAGLIFIYVAFLGQQKQMLLQNLEIKYNRYELKLTRSELKGQREQVAIQTSNLVKQNFESTFFKLISLHKENLDQWVGRRITKKNGIVESNVEVRGLYRINMVCKKVSGLLMNWQIIAKDEERDAIKKAIKNSDFTSFEIHEHYFEHISRIYEFVNSLELNESKIFYYEILSAQLSNEEKILYRIFLLYKEQLDSLKLFYDRSNIIELISDN